MVKRKILFGSLGAFAVLTISAVVYVMMAKSNQPIVPTAIQNKLTSALFLAQGTPVAVKKNTIKYDETIKQLSYVAQFAGTNVTISEQPSPDIFTDVPSYFDKWIVSTGAYTNFDTPNGKVYLASSPKYGVKTIAIMNSKGTLLFAKPSSDLSEDQWKTFFRNMKLQP